jgi:hypothetical protein
MKRQEYTTEFLTIPDQSGWSLEANCADITFTNYGTANLIINNVAILAQNQTLQVSGNTGEIDKSKYVCFYNGAGTRNAIVVKRNYK